MTETRFADTTLVLPGRGEVGGAPATSPLRRQRWVRPGAAAGVVAAWGAIAGWWMPRSPLTGRAALWSILFSLVAGLVAGRLAKSRWMMLAAPAVFAVVYELTRMGAEGPTVGGVHLTTYGVIALVVGRGFHGLLSLLPMALGASVGAAAARDMRASIPRRAMFGVGAVALVALTVGVAIPARTDPIRDANGDEVSGSVAELTTVETNGHELSLMIRGWSTDNPVLLFLAGGPGGSELGAMRRHLPDLERSFTVATLDQRGTGRSYTELDPTATLTLDNAVADTIAVTDYLRERFDQDRIYLLGQSWGSTLGVLAVQQHPEHYTAFIGVGQMVSQLATDTIFYNDTLTWAQANGDDDLVDELRSIGPPPYEQMLDYETALSYEHDIYPYDHTPNHEGEGGFSENFGVEEYSLVDKVHLLGAFMDTFSVLYPQLQDIDFRASVPRLDVATYFVQGAHEADGRAEPFADWYATLDAPAKDLAIFDTSGHRPLFEQPDEFVSYMVNTVLAETGPAEGARS